MFSCITKWLAGMTFVSLQLEKIVVPIECQDCFVVELYADCVNKITEFPPKSLRKDIEILNISCNRLYFFREEEFIEFTNLKELIVAHAFIFSFTHNLFATLVNLESLNISATPMGDEWPALPSSLKRLVAEEFKISKYGDISLMDFSELYYLEELYMTRSQLQKFPNVAVEAPLTFIDFRNNSMTELKYADIAPFCKLERFLLGGDHSTPSLSASPDRLMQCCGVKIWLEKHNVSSDLSCAGVCIDHEFDNESILAYESCIERGGVEDEISFYGTITNIVLSFAIFSAIVYLVWKYYRSHGAHKGDMVEDEFFEEEVQIEESFEVEN